MQRDRIIQLVALIVMITGLGASSWVLPPIMHRIDRNALRYTDVSVEGAPPIVAIGTAIGALRGIIVDYLWVKVNFMKEQGLFYEVMADTDLITRLQPRFGSVWVFHGHNMAYNISVATNTQQERWEWVKAGIDLVRNEGLRHNPNDIIMYKELAFWFAHKIDGYSDDAHLYYKREFAREWHFVLGEPPAEYDARIRWVKWVADAPDTLQEAIEKEPLVQELIDRLRSDFEEANPGQKFALGHEFLQRYVEYVSVKGQSTVARALNMEAGATKQFRDYDAIANDPDLVPAWMALISHLRKQVLRDDYNMDAQKMYEYTRDLGPIDWRVGQAHALYWARLGSEIASRRSQRDDDVYKILNNDRIQVQAMQALARHGRVTFDVFSSELPGRFPDPRWIDTIDKEFTRLYVKYYDTRGAGGESFINFLQNFMSSAIREWYRSGETQKAQELLDRMDQLFGRGATPPNNYWNRPLEAIVREETMDEYDAQPHLAPSDVAASLRYGFRVGIGQDRPEVWEQSLQFASWVTEYFKGNRYYDFTNKFGVGRMKDLLTNLEDSREIAFAQLMQDATLRLEERANIWSKVDDYDPTLRPLVYDQVMPVLERQVTNSEFGARFKASDIFREPPNLEQARIMLRERKARREAERLKEQQERDQMELRGGGL